MALYALERAALLDIRARNALENDGLDPDAPHSIAKMTDAELLLIPGMGRVSLNVIKQWLKDNGLGTASPPAKPCRLCGHVPCQ